MTLVPQPVNVLSPMVSPYGFPIGFAGPPIIGYAAVPNMAIIPSPAVTMYPFPAQPVSGPSQLIALILRPCMDKQVCAQLNL